MFWVEEHPTDHLWWLQKSGTGEAVSLLGLIVLEQRGNKTHKWNSCLSCFCFKISQQNFRVIGIHYDTMQLCIFNQSFKGLVEQEAMCLESKRSAVLAKIFFDRRCYSAGLLTCRFPGKKCRQNPPPPFFLISPSDKYIPEKIEVVNFMSVHCPSKGDSRHRCNTQSPLVCWRKLCLAGREEYMIIKNQIKVYKYILKTQCS